LWANFFALGGNLKDVRLLLRRDDEPLGLLDNKRILVFHNSIRLWADDDASYARGRHRKIGSEEHRAEAWCQGQIANDARISADFLTEQRAVAIDRVLPSFPLK